MSNISTIVITGGPSAGKTTALSWIQNAFTKLGYTVLFVPETATEFIGGGVAPWTCGTNLEYQRVQMALQLTKERLFLQAAKTMPDENILIVCDRGTMDNRAYMNDEEFAELLRKDGYNVVQLRDHYDAVFHLVTAAKGREEFFTYETNRVRYETVEQACEIDDKLIAAWTGHPHLRVINNSTDFDEKMRRLIAEIRSFLGEPEPLEIERKFLIEYPDLEWLTSQPHCRKVDITQTYLISLPGETLRVRQRGENGNYLYYKTTKRHITGLKRIELEERLDADEYRRLLHEADPSRHAITKERYCLLWDGQYFEIDVYPFSQDKALLELELSYGYENEEIRFPPQIRVIREVTDEKRFSNSAIASMEQPSLD